MFNFVEAWKCGQKLFGMGKRIHSKHLVWANCNFRVNFYNNHFIQIYFTNSTIQPFRAYNSMVLSIFIELCNYSHYLILEHFHYPPRQPPTHYSHFPPLCHPQPWKGPCLGQALSRVAEFILICLPEHVTRISSTPVVAWAKHRFAEWQEMNSTGESALHAGKPQRIRSQQMLLKCLYKMQTDIGDEMCLSISWSWF